MIPLLYLFSRPSDYLYNDQVALPKDRIRITQTEQYQK